MKNHEISDFSWFSEKTRDFIELLEVLAIFGMKNGFSFFGFFAFPGGTPGKWRILAKNAKINEKMTFFVIFMGKSEIHGGVRGYEGYA